MQYRKMIIVGGASFVVAALAFVFVFSYLAANFDYPDILDGSAAEVLRFFLCSWYRALSGLILLSRRVALG